MKLMVEVNQWNGITGGSTRGVGETNQDILRIQLLLGLP